MILFCFILHEGSGDRPGAKRFAQKQQVTHLHAAFGKDAVRMCKTKGDQAILRFLVLNGVPANNDRASLFGNFGTPKDYFSQQLCGQVGREGGYVQRHKGLAAHGIDIR